MSDIVEHLQLLTNTIEGEFGRDNDEDALLIARRAYSLVRELPVTARASSHDGVSVSESVDFGTHVRTDKSSVPCTAERALAFFTVRPATVQNCLIVSNVPALHVCIGTGDGGTRQTPPVVLAGETSAECRVRIDWHRVPLGTLRAWLVLRFNNASIFVRSVRASVVDTLDAQSMLNPHAPEFIPARILRLIEAKPVMVYGPPPPDPTLRLPQFVPLFDVLQTPLRIVPPLCNPVKLTKVAGCSPTELTPDVYPKHLQNMLWFEERQLERDLRMFTLFQTTLTAVAGATPSQCTSYTLNVPGILENHPPVYHGDRLLVRFHNIPIYEYEGVVSAVNRRTGDIVMCMNITHAHTTDTLDPPPTFPCVLRFTLSGKPMAEMKRASALIGRVLGGRSSGMRQRLFPTIDVLTIPLSNAVSLLVHDRSIRDEQSRVEDEHKSTPSTNGRSAPFLVQQQQQEQPQYSMAMAANDATVLLNHSQRRAVCDIDAHTNGVLPYVVFGPPGSGKTATVVAAVRRVCRRTTTRVLITAPSHAAADVLVARLSCFFSPADMFRLFDASRDKSSIPAYVQAYTRFVNEAGLDLPVCAPLADLVGFRIVVATCVDSGTMRSLGLSSQHFTHLFVDECAQATEPEVLVPLSIVDLRCQVVLAGDHFQLGPNVRSPQAVACGFQMSLQERLMHLPVYQQQLLYVRRCTSTTGTSNRSSHQESRAVDMSTTATLRSLTQLRHNYRNHPAMLALPSDLFYGGARSLECHAPAHLTDRCCDWPQLSNGRVPVLFYHVEGDCMSDESDRSAFNIFEASAVSRLVVDVLKHLEQQHQKEQQQQQLGVLLPLTATNVGVIAPFRSQVKRIRELLRRAGAGQVNVGTAEDLQGQEREIVFVSTTRSRVSRVTHDVRLNVGLVHQPKRFNVSITRSQCLLVVVGNARVLSVDPLWRRFIGFCERVGNYTGDARRPRNLCSSKTSYEEREHFLAQVVGAPCLGAAAAAAAVAAGEEDSVDPFELYEEEEGEEEGQKEEEGETETNEDELAFVHDQPFSLFL